MPTTVTASTLKVTVKEEITLNGKKHEYKQEQSIANVNMIAQRIVRVPTSLKTILSFGSAIAAGTYVAGDVKYVRITNLDDTNFVTIGLLDSDNAYDRAYFKIEKGETIVFHNSKIEAHADNSAFAAFVDFDTINAQADTGAGAAVDIEIFVASSQS